MGILSPALFPFPHHATVNFARDEKVGIMLRMAGFLKIGKLTDWGWYEGI
jgi:hypothetical protein